jgi:hypothetical protein
MSAGHGRLLLNSHVLTIHLLGCWLISVPPGSVVTQLTIQSYQSYDNATLAHATSATFRQSFLWLSLPTWRMTPNCRAKSEITANNELFFLFACCLLFDPKDEFSKLRKTSTGQHGVTWKFHSHRCENHKSTWTCDGNNWNLSTMVR